MKSIRHRFQLKFISPLLATSFWGIFTAASVAQPLEAVDVRQVSQHHCVSPVTDVSLPKSSSGGTQVSLNGRTLSAAWQQWQSNEGKVHTALSDAGIMQLLGVELLNTNTANKQPVQWFSEPTLNPVVLESWHRGYRYLDVTQLASLGGWQLCGDRGVLHITTPTAKVKALRLGKQPWGDRIVVDLDRPTTWQVTQQPPPAKPKVQLPLSSQILPLKSPNQEWLLVIDAIAAPTLSQDDTKSDAQTLVQLETQSNLTKIHLSVPAGLSPRVTTLPNPNRLIIDLRPDTMVERNILWANGLRWRQQFVSLGDARFPVVWLEINPRSQGLTLKPVWSDTKLVGIAPLLKTAQRYQAAAAINGGFFNRNNKLPLGAIRRDGRWLSSPILNRGAIAWNNSGQTKIARLNLEETAITSTGQRLSILTLNSGYVKSGVARYTSDWGATYTPLTDNEIIFVIQNNQVTAQLPGEVAGKTAFPIPTNGYLLALRGSNATTNFLPIGTLIRQESSTIPAQFASYPQILGAGPLLVQNRQIVLNAKAEGFSDAFIQEKAARSAICTTLTGEILIAAVHNRVDGDGPTLAEIAQVMQQLECVDALNLDGGSSTSLYLGGQLLNRSPHTAARVHNGLGVFFEPLP